MSIKDRSKAKPCLECTAVNLLEIFILCQILRIYWLLVWLFYFINNNRHKTVPSVNGVKSFKGWVRIYSLLSDELHGSSVQRYLYMQRYLYTEEPGRGTSTCRGTATCIGTATCRGTSICRGTSTWLLCVEVPLYVEVPLRGSSVQRYLWRRRWMLIHSADQ